MSEPLQINIENVVRNKAPRHAKKIPQWVFRRLEKIICQKEMNQVLVNIHGNEGVDFADALLKDLNVTLRIEGAENLPETGRYTFASNHPLGGFDGISLISALGKKYHGKLKVLVNDILMYLKPLAPVFLPINKYGAQAKESTQSIQEAYDSDDQILVFPAGLVSRLQKGGIKDLEWKKAFIAKAIQSRRDIIPIYFEGLNSPFFYRFAKFRKAIGLKFNIEIIFLPSELMKSRNKTFTIHIGKPIPWQTFDKSKSLNEWAAFVKNQVYHIKA